MGDERHKAADSDAQVDWTIRLGQIIDANQRLIRSASVALPVAGVLLLSYRAGLWTRFTSWEAARGASSLSGYVASITITRSRVHVFLDHTTVLRRALGLNKSEIPAAETLPTTLAAIRPADSYNARVAIKNMLWRRNVHVSPLDVDTSQFRPAVVYRGVRWWKWDVSERLLRRGHAVVDMAGEAASLEPGVLQRYVRAQDAAQAFGRGIWRRSAYADRGKAFWRILQRGWESRVASN
ncbi:TNase-like domain-containing protein [Plasmodiophora brassicae]